MQNIEITFNNSTIQQVFPQPLLWAGCTGFVKLIFDLSLEKEGESKEKKKKMSATVKSI